MRQTLWLALLLGCGSDYEVGFDPTAFPWTLDDPGSCAGEPIAEALGNNTLLVEGDFPAFNGDPAPGEIHIADAVIPVQLVHEDGVGGKALPRPGQENTEEPCAYEIGPYTIDGVELCFVQASFFTEDGKRMHLTTDACTDVTYTEQ